MNTTDLQDQLSQASEIPQCPELESLTAGPCLTPHSEATSRAIHFHLEKISSIIERMATNSESSKTWCISLVSAIIVVASEQKKSQLIWLALVPTLMFFVLDVYYLSLERGFRSSYAEFVMKLRTSSLAADDLYLFDPGDLRSQLRSSILSFSVLPFYGLLTGSIVLVFLLLDPH
jgi:hypothetical protein